MNNSPQMGCYDKSLGTFIFNDDRISQMGMGDALSDALNSITGGLSTLATNVETNAGSLVTALPSAAEQAVATNFLSTATGQQAAANATTAWLNANGLSSLVAPLAYAQANPITAILAGVGVAAGGFFLIRELLFKPKHKKKHVAAPAAPAAPAASAVIAGAKNPRRRRRRRAYRR